MTKALYFLNVWILGARCSLEGNSASRRLSIVALLSTQLIACAAQSGPTQPAAPQRLAIGYAAPFGQGEIVNELATEGLLQTMPDGTHEPRLAESWTISPDGLTVDIQVRAGVLFHDGAELDAEVVGAYLRQARTDPGLLQTQPALADIESIETAPPYGLRIHLTRPSALIEDALSIGIERREEGHLIGTGPFALTDETGDDYTFIAHRDYHRGTPAVDVVTLTTYPSHRLAWVAMMRNEIDFLHQVPTNAREFIEAESSVDLYSVARPYAFTVALNTTKPLLRSTEVRQALNHAVDRQAVIERALAGYSQPASGVWAPHWAYGGIERVYRFDPLLADEMLTRAGFPPPDDATRSRSSDRVPARLRFNLLVPSDTSTSETIALVIQQQMHAVGVDLTLESIDPRQLFSRVTSGDWDAALVPQNTARTPSRLYNIWHSSQPLALYGHSAEADEVLESLRYAENRQELVAATTAFQQMLYDNPPGIFIAEDRHARAVSRRFEIPPLEPGSDVFDSFWRWRRVDVLP